MRRVAATIPMNRELKLLFLLLKCQKHFVAATIPMNRELKHIINSINDTVIQLLQPQSQ